MKRVLLYSLLLLSMIVKSQDSTGLRRFINNVQLQTSLPIQRGTADGFGIGLFAHHYLHFTANEVIYLGGGIDVSQRYHGGVMNYPVAPDSSYLTIAQLDHKQSTWADLSLNIGYKRLVYGSFGLDVNVYASFGLGWANGNRLDSSGQSVGAESISLFAISSGGAYGGIFYSFPLGLNRMNVGLGMMYNTPLVGTVSSSSEYYGVENYNIAGSNSTLRLRFTYVFGARQSISPPSEIPIPIVVPAF